jgi:integrase
MPRKRNGSPYYHYDFTIQGRRFRGSTETRDKEAAKVIETKRRAEVLLDGALDRKPQASLDETCGRYLLEHAHRLASVGTLDYQLNNLLTGLGKNTHLKEITDNDVAIYVARRRNQVSDSSVNRELTLLRAVLRMARDRWGYEVTMPNWKAHWLREPEPRDRYLSPEEAQRLLKAAAPHLKPAIEFSLLTGVRLSNCARLDWSQIDMQRREIVLRIKSRSPGGKPHVIPMSEPVTVLLANLGPKDSGPVFTYKGRAVKKWQTAWEGALRRAGIKDLRWHDLRHTAASWLVQAGVELDVVKDVLGHESIQTTLRYAHRDTGAKRRALDAIAAHIGHNSSEDDPQGVDNKKKRRG